MNEEDFSDIFANVNEERSDIWRKPLLGWWKEKRERYTKEMKKTPGEMSKK